MLSLKDFKAYEVCGENVTGGNDIWGYDYTCNDTSQGGFSTIGPDVDLVEMLDRCGLAGATITPIYM